MHGGSDVARRRRDSRSQALPENWRAGETRRQRALRIGRERREGYAQIMERELHLKVEPLKLFECDVDDHNLVFFVYRVPPQVIGSLELPERIRWQAFEDGRKRGGGELG